MGKEDKQILLKDLCARLPYGVICDMWFEWNEADKITEVLKCGGLMRLMNKEFNFVVKPYLRPLSSMTKEELSFYNNHLITPGIAILEENLSEYLDWMHSHHFDYRGLIPMGLALEAPEGMYKEEK